MNIKDIDMQIDIVLNAEQMRNLRLNKPITLKLDVVMSSELIDSCRDLTIKEFTKEYLPDAESINTLSDRCGLNRSIFNKMFHGAEHLPSNKTNNKLMMKLNVRVVI